jgi:hypothetical protein
MLTFCCGIGMRSSQLRLLIFGLLLTVGALAVVGSHPVMAQSYNNCYYNNWGQWVCSSYGYPYGGYYPYYGYGYNPYYHPGCTYTWHPGYATYSPYFWWHNPYYTYHC